MEVEGPNALVDGIFDSFDSQALSFCSSAATADATVALVSPPRADFIAPLLPDRLLNLMVDALEAVSLLWLLLLLLFDFSQ